MENKNYIQRILRAYHENVTDHDIQQKHESTCMWKSWIEPKYESVLYDITTHNEDKVSYHLKNPRTNFLTFGFDNLFLNRLEDSKESLPFFFNLCRAIGLLRVPWPENLSYEDVVRKQVASASIEDLLIQLDAYFGFRVDFPNIFNDEFGYPTSRGIMNIRSAHSLYFVHRIKTVLGDTLKGSKIMEIGGGMGRNAYYLKKMGVDIITIIDIPIPLLVSSYWLGNTVGNDSLCLHKEVPQDHSKIFMLPPSHYIQPPLDIKKYDLIVQFDGLTEMGRSTAQNYMDKFPDIAHRFLSINHDDNEYTVRELYTHHPRIALLERFPSWYRPGYIEELLSARS